MTLKAAQRTDRLTWLGLGLMGLQFGLLARLTWWEYSWDIMEPVTYFVGYGSAIAMFGYYILTKQVLCYVHCPLSVSTSQLNVFIVVKNNTFWCSLVRIANYQHFNPHSVILFLMLLCCDKGLIRLDANPAVHGWESNSQPVDHKSDALTTTPPSHLFIIALRTLSTVQSVC